MEKLIQNLINIGADVDSILIKLGGNETIYCSICNKFLQDTNYVMFFASMEANDMNLAGMYIHTLKGVAANLGFTRLSQISSSILEDIKNNDMLFLHKKINELTEEYTRIKELISSYATSL